MKFTIFFLSLLLLGGCTSSKQETRNSKLETNTDPNEYYENGNIRIEKIINGNEEHWIFKQEDGGCWEEKFFKDGEEYKRIVYNSNCVKSAQYELKNGNRNGEWISYHDNGKIREKGKYEDGIPNGIFEYYDESGVLNYKEHNFTLDSNHVSFWPFENNYENFIEWLSNKKNHSYSIDETIEVAGKKKYHFPIIRTGETILYFDMKENNEIVKCVRGELKDCSFMILEKICPNMADGGLIVLSGAKWEKGMTQVNVYNLKDETLYKFYLKDDQLKSISFEGINRRN